MKAFAPAPEIPPSIKINPRFEDNICSRFTGLAGTRCTAPNPEPPPGIKGAMKGLH